MTLLIVPRRIQRRRTVGWQMPPNAIYVGRPTIFGNPFQHRDSRIAARMYRCWLLGTMRTIHLLDCTLARGMADTDERRRIILESAWQLRGRDVACWCPIDADCHADTILEIANGR